MVVYDKIIYVMDGANVIYTLPTDVLSTVPTNFTYKRARCKMNYFILHMLLLGIILLLVITIICDQYTKHKSK